MSGSLIFELPHIDVFVSGSCWTGEFDASEKLYRVPADENHGKISRLETFNNKETVSFRWLTPNVTRNLVPLPA